MNRLVYKAIAGTLKAKRVNEECGSKEWYFKHSKTLKKLVKQYLPSGSGFDCGTSLNEERSTDNKLVFETSFHHMNDVGCYCGWTDHTVTIKPDLVFDLDIKVSGRDKNGIKDYIAETFHYDLTRHTNL